MNLLSSPGNPTSCASQSCGSATGAGIVAMSSVNYYQDPDLCLRYPYLCTTYTVVNLGVGSGSAGGNNSGQAPQIGPQPTLTFKPPSWQNFTQDFLPCYGAQLLDNFVGNKGKAAVTAGTVALTAKNPLLGGSLLVVWTGINAFKAGAACAVASRAVYK